MIQETIEGGHFFHNGLYEGDEDATLGFVHRTSDDKFLVLTDDDVELGRSEMHELHAWLTEALGMTHPTPSGPKTASRAGASPPSSRTAPARRLPGGSPSDVV
ncbi:MAG: hypothetical protein V3U14_12980 [candidate division NC10 bacterium]